MKRISMFLGAVAMTMLVTLSAVAGEVGVKSNFEPEYAAYAGLAQSVELLADAGVNLDTAYKVSMTSSMEFVHLKLVKLKPLETKNFPYSVMKVSNDAKMQNQNCDRVVSV